MNFVDDNFEFDGTNVDLSSAADFVKHTNKLIYLTGKAGTGKTTFLKYLKHTSKKNTVIVAPTGVAAINAGGQTIHSFFQIKPSVYVPNDKRLRTKADSADSDKSTIYDHFKYLKDRLEIIRGMELLIIDEISMVRCDLLDVVDRLLRVFRRRYFEPFGGVQTILIGDTFQLPPIAEFDQWEILNKFYESPFFFSSIVIKENKPIYIELKKIYRQNEQEFIDLLNRVRVNQITESELTILNSKFNPGFSPQTNEKYITLATHNSIVNTTNLSELSKLTSELILFEAVTTGVFPDNIMPTERILQLKEGAQIMFVKNDRQKRFYNGKIAKIKSITDSKILVEFSENNEITVEKETWNNIKYLWNEEKRLIEEVVIGTFTQFPLRLAWAITVHKSQGMTFEKVIADLGSAFTSGQVYVALSRCTSFNGLVLKTRIDRNAIKTDPHVLNFAQNETPSTLMLKELNSGKADYFYKKAREAFKQNDFKSSFDNLLSAIKYRNDLETEVFERYLFISFSRLAICKKNAVKIAEELDNVQQELRHYIVSNVDLKIEIGKQSEKITEQNISLKLILEKTKELETAKNLSDKSAAELTLELLSVKEKLSSTHSKNRILENQINDFKQEVGRLKNIKWYQKLFGVK